MGILSATRAELKPMPCDDSLCEVCHDPGGPDDPTPDTYGFGRLARELADAMERRWQTTVKVCQLRAGGMDFGFWYADACNKRRKARAQWKLARRAWTTAGRITAMKSDRAMGEYIERMVWLDREIAHGHEGQPIGTRRKVYLRMAALERARVAQ